MSQRTNQARETKLHAFETREQARLGGQVGRKSVVESFIDQHGHQCVQPVSQCRQVDLPAIERPGYMAAVKISRVIDTAFLRIHKRIVIGGINLPFDHQLMFLYSLHDRTDPLRDAAERVGCLYGIIGMANGSFCPLKFLTNSFPDLI